MHGSEHATQNGARRSTGGADIRPMHDVGEVGCETEVDLVIFRFSSFGRLAHFRRSLLGVPGVRSARIANYGDRTALFALNVTPGLRSGALVLPGTRLIGSDGKRVELCVEAW
jgi:hypothetical protein